MVRMPASHATKSHARSTRFGDVTASSTRLRTKSRIDKSHFPSGTLSLLDNQPRNQSESRIEQRGEPVRAVRTNFQLIDQYRDVRLA